MRLKFSMHALGLVCLMLALFVPSLSYAGVVLMYHRFDEPDYPTTNIQMDQFKAQIDMFERAGLEIIPIEDMLQAHLANQPQRDKTIVITVDDAFRSFYDSLWPYIQEKQLPVALFVSTAPVQSGGSDYMSFDQLREVQASGLVTIAGHSHDHVNMTILEPAEQDIQLETAKALMQSELGIDPKIFSFPYGATSAALKAKVKDHGYQLAFGQHSGVAVERQDQEGESRGLLDPFYVPRFPINENYGDLGHLSLVMQTLPLPIKDILPKDTLLGEQLLGEQNDKIIDQALPNPPNPPNFGFTLADADIQAQQLTCYVSSGVNVLSQNQYGNRIEVRFDAPFPKGRTRINCTLRAPSGRWHWFGMQFQHN
ncbi:MAG: polysaccharide deacetylase family protein [Alphaproteobacteria bacterium]